MSVPLHLLATPNWIEGFSMYYANEYVGVSGGGHNRFAVGCVELRKWPSLSLLIVTTFAISFPKSRFNSNRFVLIAVQRDATQSSLFIILQVHSTCFGCQPNPSSRVHKTVTTFSGTAATSLQRDQAWLRWREVAVQTILPIPEAAVIVLCTHHQEVTKL